MICMAFMTYMLYISKQALMQSTQHTIRYTQVKSCFPDNTHAGVVHDVLHQSEQCMLLCILSLTLSTGVISPPSGMVTAMAMLMCSL